MIGPLLILTLPVLLYWLGARALNRFDKTVFVQCEADERQGPPIETEELLESFRSPSDTELFETQAIPRTQSACVREEVAN